MHAVFVASSAEPDVVVGAWEWQTLHLIFVRDDPVCFVMESHVLAEAPLSQVKLQVHICTR